VFVSAVELQPGSNSLLLRDFLIEPVQRVRHLSLISQHYISNIYFLGRLTQSVYLPLYASSYFVFVSISLRVTPVCVCVR